MTDTGVDSTDEGAPVGLDPGTWRLAVVAGVRMDLPGEHPEVLVHEAVSPWRELAIPVGMADGNAIAFAWRGLTTPRPLTHALFTDVLERHGVQLEAVRITARRGRSYFAELDTVGPRGRQVIPCRPSDALALVLRQRMPTPVLVADWVFDPEVDDDLISEAVPPAEVVVAPSPTTDVPTTETPASEVSPTETPLTDMTSDPVPDPAVEGDEPDEESGD
jgi:bifunctional DNase/RNase